MTEGFLRLLIENGEIAVENLPVCGCRFTVTLPDESAGRERNA